MVMEHLTRPDRPVHRFGMFNQLSYASARLRGKLVDYLYAIRPPQITTYCLCKASNPQTHPFTLDVGTRVVLEALSLGRVEAVIMELAYHKKVTT